MGEHTKASQTGKLALAEVPLCLRSDREMLHLLE